MDPRVYERGDGSGWIAEVYVAEAVGSNVVDTQYLLKETFPTEEAAMAAALAEGRRIVDGGA